MTKVMPELYTEKLNEINHITLENVANSNIKENKEKESSSKGPKVVTGSKSYNDSHKDVPRDNIPNKSHKKSVKWFGTSISKVMDREKFEKDTNSKLKMVKAYCISQEGRYPNSNFCKVVPEELEKEKVDFAVFQTGGIEITNIDVKTALMDSEKDITEYEKEWKAKLEEDSSNLFKLAVEVTKKNPELNVIILKRLSRFDPSRKDPKSIKKHLSNFANNVYDQLWFKHGGPKNIRVASLDLGCSESNYLKKIIYGNPDDPSFDGIHLRGPASSRHFTYRSVQLITPIMTHNNAPKYGNQAAQVDSDHTRCPQAKYQRQSHRNAGRYRWTKTKTMSDPFTHKYGSNSYSVPVQNRFPEKF